MALPTLSTRVPSRFNNPGEFMDWERERKAEKQHQLETHARHLERQNICTERHAAWTSTQCYNKSVLEYQKQCLKEEQRTNLELRRNRLRTFLQEETNHLEAELRDMVSNMETRKGRHQQKIRERDLARQDRGGKVEPELYEEDDVGQWQEQLSDKEQLQVSEQEEDKLFENEYEIPQSEVLKRMMQADEKKKCEEKKRMDNIRRQMEELKLWEAETVQLNEEQKALLAKQMQLENIQNERKELEDRQKKPEMRRFLVHHYRTQMIRRGEQVRAELEGQRQMLATMMEGEEEENTKSMAWMKGMIEEQLQLERKREVEIDDLRWQGAQRVWDEQELQWEEERKSRGLLMEEVLSERKQQLAVKIQKNREAQEQCRRRRTELIQELDRQGS